MGRRGGHLAAAAILGLTGTTGLALLPAGGARAATGDSTFAAPTSHAAGARPAPALIAADVNGDGRPDLVTAEPGASAGAAGTVTVLAATGSGGFAAPAHYPTGIAPDALAVGDVNGDGVADIVTGNDATPGPDSPSSGGGGISVLLGQTAGGYAAPTQIPLDDHVTGILIADLNGDGRLDLATSDLAGNGVAVLLNTGTGFGTPTTYDGASAPVAIAAGDLDGDGDTDLVAAGGTGSAAVFTGDGKGGFSRGSQRSTGPAPTAVAVTDLDGDGHADIVTSNDNPGNKDAGTVSVLRGPTFQSTANTPTGMGAADLAIADVDGDGRPDVVTADAVAGTVSVLFSTAGGQLTAAQPLGLGSDTAPRAVAATDLDGDGRADLAVATTGSGGAGAVTVLLQARPSTGDPVVSDLTLSPATATIVLGGTQGYASQGRDANGVETDATGDTAFSIAPDGSCSGRICSPAAVGTHTVTGVSNGLTATARLDVSPTPTTDGGTGGTGPGGTGGTGGAGGAGTPTTVTLTSSSTFATIGSQVTYTAALAPVPATGTAVVFTETYSDGKVVPLGQAATTAAGTAAITNKPLYNGIVTASALGAAGSTPSRVIVTYRSVTARVVGGRLVVHAETRPGFVTSPARQERVQVLLVDAGGRIQRSLTIVNAAQRRSFAGEAQGTNAMDATVGVPVRGPFHIAVKVIGTPVNTGAQSRPVRVAAP